jgi:hypothetical protein
MAMTSFDIGGAVGRSFERTRDMLFGPFSLKKWLRLLVISLLAGASGYAGWQGGFNQRPGKASQEIATATSSVDPEAARRFKEAVSQLWERVPLKGGVAAGGSVALALLFFLFLWLNARFEFVWVNAVRENTAEISGPFDAYARQGNSLFFFNLAVAAAWLLLLLLVGGWAGKTLLSANGAIPWTFARAAKALAPHASLLVVGALFQAFLQVLVVPFMVPLMASENLTAWPALRRWLGIARGRKADLFWYVLAWMGLRLGALILALSGVIAVGMACLMAGGVLVGASYLIFFKALGLKVLTVVVILMMGPPLVFLAVLLVLAVQLPFSVFFRAFSLQFLAAAAPGHDAPHVS